MADRDNTLSAYVIVYDWKKLCKSSNMVLEVKKSGYYKEL